MKRILKWLGRLYPSSWRNRYGAEYEELLEQSKPRAGDAVDVLWGALKMQMTTWSFVRIVLPSTLAGMLAATLISLVSAPQFVSQTQILMGSGAAGVDSGICGDQTSLPKELRGFRSRLCVTQHDFGYYQKFLEGSGFSREFLASVISENNLYPRITSRSSLDSAINEMQKNIQVRSVPNQSRFALEFNYPDPSVAQRVNDELISYLVHRVGQEVTSDFLKVPFDPPSNLSDVDKKQIEQIRQQMTLAQHAPFDPRSQMLHLATFPQSPLGFGRLKMSLTGLISGFCGGVLLTYLKRHRQSRLRTG
jgi:hypothetical protein